jgi:pantoate kinase
MVIVAQLPVSIARSFCPGHLTGFFATDKNTEITNPNLVGSVGSGFSISKGIYTTVKVYNDHTKNYKININGKTAFDAKVSQFVAECYLKMVDKPVFISIEHESEIPFGFGLGSSGAAALGLSYALNQALNANLSRIESAQIAHHADIACKTGLGSVVSEFIGGFEIRTKIGAPGIGKILKIPVSSQYCIIVLCIKPISTKHALEKKDFADANNPLNIYGRKMISELVGDPTIDKFLDLSRDFAKKCGLLNGYCKDPIDRLESVGIKSSVALFGHTLFTIVKKEKIPQVIQILKQFEGNLLICDIDSFGARLV